ncbi:MAG TPA: IS5/IS1182 family transposase, partial [Bacteroidota bacterium]
MGFVEGSDRGQRMLFPESVDDYITGDNPVRFIEAFVESQDLIKLGFTHAIP